jgi:hypothetical protein
MDHYKDEQKQNPSNGEVLRGKNRELEMSPLRELGKKQLQ